MTTTVTTCTFHEPGTVRGAVDGEPVAGVVLEPVEASAVAAPRAVGSAVGVGDTSPEVLPGLTHVGAPPSQGQESQIGHNHTRVIRTLGQIPPMTRCPHGCYVDTSQPVNLRPVRYDGHITAGRLQAYTATYQCPACHSTWTQPIDGDPR